MGLLHDLVAIRCNRLAGGGGGRLNSRLVQQGFQALLTIGTLLQMLEQFLTRRVTKLVINPLFKLQCSFITVHDRTLEEIEN